MILIKLTFAFALCIGFSSASIGGAFQQSVAEPDKHEYRAAIPHSDKNKFGYELGENKHFHHTTTEEDGVRLGCYGHVLEGKKYSTQYVADAKGYRIVNTHGLITVYPKSGFERKASFVRDFSEDVLMSQNIGFFFPDGCGKDKQIEAAESQVVPVIVAPPTTTTPRPTTTQRPTTTPIPTTTCQPPKCVCTCE